MRLAVLRGLVAMAAVLGAATALAQDGSPRAPADGRTSVRGAAPKRKVIEMDPLEVIGKVQKPHVFLVIERGDLKHRGLPLERSLLKEIEESVKRPPF